MATHKTEFTDRLSGDLSKRVHTCARLLTSPEVRLLTLSGPPGVGKTWLMDRTTQVLGGTLFTRVERLDLSRLDNWLLFLPTLAESLGLASGEQSLWSVKESLLEHLRDETVLLVLDAFENLLPAASGLSELLGASSGLKILVTSRQPLGLVGEHVWRVKPLALPNLAEPSTWLQASSVDLFTRQVQMRMPAFQLEGDTLDAVTQVCVRLDGLPLALRAAARQLVQSDLASLLSELAEPSYLKRWNLEDLGRPPTLYAALEWSYQNLSQDEQKVVKYASVFEDSFSLAALVQMRPRDLEAVDLAQTLESLSAKHFIKTVSPKKGEPGYQLSYLMQDFLRLELAESGEDARIKSAYDALKYVESSPEIMTYEPENAVTEASAKASTSNDVDRKDNEQMTLETPTIDAFEDEAELLELVTEALTERETDVLKLVARGLSNREVAAHLDISHRTVSTHLSNIYSKLNVHTRTAAARRARQLNLVSDA